MIEYADGDLLDTDADALVNTVNTVGHMGKGLALEVKRKYPHVYETYRAACDAGRMEVGRMLVVETGQLVPRLIVNFPTKKHWRGKSRLEYIEDGLRDLVAVVHNWEVTSLAVPPLGCGNGGLLWTDVEPLIKVALEPLDTLDVRLYRP